MAKEQIPGSRGVAGYLRVIIFVFLFLGLLVGGGVMGGLLGLDIYLLTTLLSLLSVLLIYVLRTGLDRESWISLGWQWKGFEKDFFAGLLMALAMLGTGTCILAFSKNIGWMEVKWTGESFFLSMGLMIMVAIYEELAFRGYIMGNLMKSVPPAAALLISALIFAIFHGSNPNNSWLALVNVFLAGVLLGMNYLFTRNLWFAIGLHFCWNFVQGPVLGYEVSGLSLPSILTQIQNGPELLTGGRFGFEGSILDTILSLIAIAIVYFIYKTRKNPAA